MPEGKSEYFSGNWTHVFWLTDDYPVPIDFNIDDIHEAIKEALLRMGFDKVQPIRKFCDKNKQCDASAPLTMVREILFLAASMCDDPVNLIVIAKQSTHPEVDRVLHCLESRNNPVLLVQLPDDFSVDSLVASTHDLRGGKPQRPESYVFPLNLEIGSGSGSDSDYDSDTATEESAYRWRKRVTYKLS
ncbi:uncharacterized protein LOC103868859 [Brassica rapa]|uniref:BnaA05g18550D protein n=3 Tax=Brassica TaxID=3705 RepID=A0A078GP89_BRANA|nr:uncharacterized protein LOC103868859 [Brassica rapa]XP_048635399.1 uncharacterized protein LOC125608876 [Brassica napus]KAH0926426.1 hypothetical protein HID58_018682 [Brassica napus]CAF2098773.1 unnamed protein product [Brassica napus]CDY28385.1 BnaA05g18550D [Brassica napus]